MLSFSWRTRRCTLGSRFLSLDQRAEEDRYATRIRKCATLHQLKRLETEIRATEFWSSRYLGNLYIQAYGSLGRIEDARSSFEKMPNRNPYTWNFIIAAYAQNGHVEDAREVFEKLPAKSNVTWNTMITGYTQNGHLEQAKELFDLFPVKDVVSRNVMLTAYAQEGDLHQAKLMFNSIPREERTAICWNNILSAHASNGFLEEAKAVFESMTERNVTSWNAMMTAYTQNGDFNSAIHLFRLMKLQGERPNRISFTCVAEACGALADFKESISLLSCVDPADSLVGNALITMFFKCGSLHNAKLVFDSITEPSSITCTTMVNAYAQEGHLLQARRLFEEISNRDVVAWTTMVAGYANNDNLDEAEKLFRLMPWTDALAWSTILHSLASNGDVEKASEFHKEMPCREVSTWTALISGHVRAGNDKQALELFTLMDMEGLEPDKVTFVSALEACANSTSIIEGRSIYEDVVARSYDTDMFVGTSLVNMFGKCGKLEEARVLFHSVSDPNIVTWTTVIVAYARSGDRRTAAEMFNRMVLTGEKPNWITFAAVLAACSHGGLYKDARDYFLRMVGDHSVAPVVEHYRCLVDLLGRSGQLDRMEELATSMPFPEDEIAWTAVLNACSLHGDAERGARVAERVMEQDLDRGSGLYMLLANLYTTVHNSNLN